MKNILKVESPNQAITYPHLVKEIVYQYERFRDAQSQTRFVNLIGKAKIFFKLLYMDVCFTSAYKKH